MVMNRREFLRQCSVAMGAGGLLLSNRGLDVSIRVRYTNVLFVLADQWRDCAFSHGANHDEVVQTPNLDQLATEGVRWSRCYAAHPVCTPNRTSIITGRWPHQTGMITNDLMIPPTERCMAEVFYEGGYRTHYIGKWHVDGEAKPGFVPKGWRRRGFTTFEGFNRGHFYYDTPTFSNDGKPIGTPGDYEPTFQTDLAIDFMTENKDKPFFCYVSWGPPHTPYTPPDEFDIYDPAEIVPRPNMVGYNSDKLAKYFGLCTSLDYEFGRLMTALNALGLDENTLVVFSADHGDCIGSHGIDHKGHPEEESCHIPLIMRWPGRLKDGNRVDNLISSADLMPTLLSMCGLEVPKTCSGKDKSAAAMARGRLADESIYSEVGANWRMVVMGPHKLVVENNGGEQVATKLFNLSNDPYELANLIDEPEHAATQAELLAEIDIWKQKTGDVFPDPPFKAEKMYDV
ncbi:MAG: sulfatase-like hydrolase/transferase [Planctomycetes bacterium]|nr:sulfatase-like hydrolase/transferase [Planctomycetota bacterium]